MKFKLNEMYYTPYGIARVVRMFGECAEFNLLQPNDVSKRQGWKQNMTFLAHPDDAVSPPVPESYFLIPQAN